MQLKTIGRALCVVAVVAAGLCARLARAADQWVVYPGGDGAGKGKHIVFVAGDEEYRSEEGLPQLAKILSKHHGFKCTVVFPVDEKGEINPNFQKNLPGIEALASADLMVILTRFRNLPDAQMKFVDEYVKAGKPVIGLRTATHAFNIPAGQTYSKYGNAYKGEEYRDGFGRQVLGETWVNHWGEHKKQSTKGIIPDDAKSHPILRGVGDIWVTTDVYEARDLPANSTVLVRGQVLKGMKPTDPPAENKKKRALDKQEQPVNDPMMPIAWARTYKGEKGNEGRVFTTTMGAATDLPNDGLRRMLVNATFWCLGMEDKITDKLATDIVGPYNPTQYGFNEFKKGTKPSDYELK